MGALPSLQLNNVGLFAYEKTKQVWDEHRALALWHTLPDSARRTAQGSGGLMVHRLPPATLAAVRTLFSALLPRAAGLGAAERARLRAEVTAEKFVLRLEVPGLEPVARSVDLTASPELLERLKRDEAAVRELIEG